MQVITGSFALLTPILLGTWLGSRARRPQSAFVLGWLATPVMAFVTALVMIPFISTPGASWAAIELPILGIGLGLVSGALAAFIAHRRLVAVTASSPDEPQDSAVRPESQPPSNQQ